jgi:hypothetical protein
LYHEKRIALVNNFVYLVPLKNIVQGRKIFKGGKEISLGKFFSTFLSLGYRSGKELSLGNIFSTFEYPFLPWDNIFQRD